MDLYKNPDAVNAFQWWNSQNKDCIDLTKPPQIVPAKIATSIFYNICPTLMIFDEFNDNDQAYWGEIHRFFNCRFKKIEIPSPSSDFPAFIIEIYKLKDKIKPNNVEECFEFIKSYQTAQPAFFLLRQYPIIINDPVLYFETIIYFSKFDNQTWQVIIKEYRFFDNFFYMNRSFFTHFPKSSKVTDWTTILLCSAAFSKVLSASLEYHTHAFSQSMLYIKEIVKFFEIIPDEIFISLLRDIFSVIKSSYQKVTLREKLENKVYDIIQILHSKNPNFLKYAIQFCLSYEPNIVSKSLITEILAQRELNNIIDIEVLEKVCDSTTAYEILVYLSKNMIQSKLFHRSCSSFILNILEKYDKDQKIIDYTNTFIESLFIFISLAKKAQKYKVRTMLICESMSLFLESKIYWLQKIIMSCASTISQIGYFPCYFDILFPISFPKNQIFGNLLTTTMTKYKKSKIKFFPFIKAKNEYSLYNLNIPKIKKANKKIDDCINVLKALKTKTRIQNLIISLAFELRNLFVLQAKFKHLFPANFDAVLLYLIKMKDQLNMINLYQLMRIVLLFFDDSNFSRVIDFLKFGIETKTFNSIYEFGIITKKYGITYKSLASVAIDRLIESELSTPWTIQTYRRIIKNSKINNELVSVIALSSIASDDEFVKIEGIKTLPYILYEDIDELSVYKNLKNDLTYSKSSINNNVLFIASKSLTNTVYNDVSIAQNIFSRLIKKMDRLKAFYISFTLFLKHFSISNVFQSLNQWSLFLLNLNDKLTIEHISAVSKIVIKSFVSILGEKCPMTKILLQNIDNKNLLSNKQTVVVLNSFALCHSSSKFILNHQEIFFNSLNNENKKIRNLSCQCFEKIAKNHQSISKSFLQRILKNNQNNVSYYQAEALILKHISYCIDEDILNIIISNNSPLNIIVLSFLLPQQIPQNVFNYENEDNIIKKTLNSIQSSNENKYKNYLSFFLFKHQKIIPVKLALIILRTLVDKFDDLSDMALNLIYQISINFNDNEIIKILALKSLNVITRIFNSENFDFNYFNEFDRKSLYHINSYLISDNFSKLIIENETKNSSELLFERIISSIKSLILKLAKNERIQIIYKIIESISPTQEKNNDDNQNCLMNLLLMEQIICNEFKNQLPPNALFILLSIQRNRKNVDKISSCISKWVQLFPDSLEPCFNSFIYNDPMMFSYFLKYYSPYLNEYAVDSFYVQLKIHFDSNPLIAMKAIPSLMTNKFVTREMKNSLFTLLEELLSYDFLVRSETIRDFYEAIESFTNVKFSKIIMSLLHFPLNSSIATYFGIKLMKKIKNKSLFYPFLDEIINKNDILINNKLNNAMNNEILFEALKIRNTVDNIPLMLLLYQQSDDDRIHDLIKDTFNLNPEISQWSNLCKLVVIEKSLPMKKIENGTFSEEEKLDQIKIKPNLNVMKIMLSIAKSLVSQIKKSYPFQIEYIEIIFTIALKCFNNKKLQRKASSIFNAIINEIGEIDSKHFIFDHFYNAKGDFEVAAFDLESFRNSNKFIFSLIDFFAKRNEPEFVSNLSRIIYDNLGQFEGENDILIFLRTSSFLNHFSKAFEISPLFESKAKEFIKSVFDKKLFLHDLKGQLAYFVEILINRYPNLIPCRILRILITEEIFHKCEDSLLLAFSVLIDSFYEKSSNHEKSKHRNHQKGSSENLIKSKSEEKIESINLNGSSENSLKLSKSNESIEKNTDLTFSDESYESNVDVDSNKDNISNNNSMNESKTKNSSDVSDNINNNDDDINVDEITVVLSKVELSDFEFGFGYRCFITSIARLVPHTIGIKWKAVLKILINSSISTPLAFNFDCISIIFKEVHSKTANELVPLIFRSISLSKNNQKVVDLIPIVLEKQPPQVIENLLADLINIRSYDQKMIQKVIKICFNFLAEFNVNNSIVIEYLKRNIVDFSLSLVYDLLNATKTEKLGISIGVQLFESISVCFKSLSSLKIEKFNENVVYLMGLFDLFLTKAALFVKKKELKRFQSSIAELSLDLLQFVDEESKQKVLVLVRKIPKEILTHFWPEKRVDNEIFLNEH